MPPSVYRSTPPAQNQCVSRWVDPWRASLPASDRDLSGSTTRNTSNSSMNETTTFNSIFLVEVIMSTPYSWRIQCREFSASPCLPPLVVTLHWVRGIPSEPWMLHPDWRPLMGVLNMGRKIPVAHPIGGFVGKNPWSQWGIFQRTMGLVFFRRVVMALDISGSLAPHLMGWSPLS